MGIRRRPWGCERCDAEMQKRNRHWAQRPYPEALRFVASGVGVWSYGQPLPIDCASYS